MKKKFWSHHSEKIEKNPRAVIGLLIIQLIEAVATSGLTV